MNCIQYASGYKYLLRRMYSVKTPIYPSECIKTPWIHLSRGGMLTIMMDYAWDGPSGPTVDTKDSMRGSLIHDALYQLIRMGHLDAELKNPIDRFFRDVLIQDGMLALRAEAWYAAVRAFGRPTFDSAVVYPDQIAGCECAPGWNPQLPDQLAP